MSVLKRGYLISIPMRIDFSFAPSKKVPSWEEFSSVSGRDSEWIGLLRIDLIRLRYMFSTLFYIETRCTVFKLNILSRLNFRWITSELRVVSNIILQKKILGYFVFTGLSRWQNINNIQRAFFRILLLHSDTAAGESRILLDEKRK